jgi:hypothetical protein
LAVKNSLACFELEPAMPKSRSGDDLLQEIRAELSSHEAAIARLRMIEADLVRRMGGEATTGSTKRKGDRPQLEPIPAATGSDPSIAGLTQIEAAIVVLREQRKPVKTALLVDTLLARGIHLRKGGDAAQRKKRLTDSLFSALSRSEQVKNVGPGLWALPEWRGERQERDDEA